MLVSYNWYKACLDALPDPNSFVDSDRFYFSTSDDNSQSLCFYKNFDSQKGFYWQNLDDLEFTHSVMCPITNMPIDKQAYGIGYNDIKHVYWDLKTGKNLVSCTTLLKKYYPVFNSYLMSMYKAIQFKMGEEQFKKFRKGKTPAMVVDSFTELTQNTNEFILTVAKASNIATEWYIKGQKSAKAGTIIHKQKEDFVRGFDFNSYPDFPGKPFLLDYLRIPLSENTKLFPEILVGSLEYQVAGQIDLTLVDKDNKSFWLFDYKTNQEIERSNKYNQKMLGICKELDHCNYYHYSIQLSIYAKLFSLLTGYDCLGLYLVHVKPDMSQELIEVPNYREYAKQIIEANK